MYIDRLKRYDPEFHFVITVLEDRAMAQAKAADDDLEAGLYRGPLHGIPWGAKDLLAVKGYPTTWGAGGFEQQTFKEDATVVQRLDAAGAVLVAKFSLGALAMGDKWFGGRTRNPWNPAQGSSGSSAGSASAVAAGCVGFAIGSETLGSISSPSTRCGCSGLRPSFGMVPRTGAMALSWTMDKLGPICRSVEDCALVLDVIHGPDGKDLSAGASIDFHWNPDFDWRALRVGYFKGEFDPLPPLQLKEAAPNETPEETKKREDANAAAQDDYARRTYDKKYEQAALDALTKMGVSLIPVELPKLPWDAMVPLLTAEAAAAFDDLTMSGRDKLLTEQGPEDWPNDFRIARFYPAVEYIQANRARTLGVRQFAKLFEKVDIIVTPSTDEQLIATNLTGNPAVICPMACAAPMRRLRRRLTTGTTTILAARERRSRLLSSARFTRTRSWRLFRTLTSRRPGSRSCTRSSTSRRTFRRGFRRTLCRRFRGNPGRDRMLGEIERKGINAARRGRHCRVSASGGVDGDGFDRNGRGAEGDAQEIRTACRYSCRG